MVSWVEAVGQRKVEKERLLFDHTQMLWPTPPSKDTNGHDLTASTSSSSPEPGEQDVDLDSEPARNSLHRIYRGKPLKTYGGDRSQTLMPGTYTYHLKFKLPTGLPLVFEDSTSNQWLSSEGALTGKIVSKGKSYIRYYATAFLVTQRFIQSRPDSSSAGPGAAQQVLTREVNKTISSRAFFKVVEDIPLAALTAQPPIQATQSKTFLFASDAPLTVSITVGNGGLAFVGKSFNATVAVDNKSNRSVDSVRVGIDCITTFRLAAPRIAPVQAGLAGSQVQSLHPEHISPPPQPGQPDWIDNVTRTENVLTTVLQELNMITPVTARASTINVTIPMHWPGSIVTSVLIERRYELWAECVIKMGTNLMARCPLRLLEWCEHFTRILPDISPVPRDDEYDSEDSVAPINLNNTAKSPPSTPAPGKQSASEPVPPRRVSPVREAAAATSLETSYAAVPPSHAASSSASDAPVREDLSSSVVVPASSASMDDPGL